MSKVENLIKLKLRRIVGFYRLMEVRNKIVLGPASLAVRRIESAEVARLSVGFASLPQALVATIIPTYRRPDSLLRAVESALSQTVTDQVVIVVDDGGGLPDLPDDPRLFAVSLSENRGIAGLVRNVGIKLSVSQYVAFLDDDNEWGPNHLEVALAALGHGPDFVYTAVERRLPDGHLLDVLSVPFDRRVLVEEGSVVDTNAFVVRRFAGLHFSRLVRSRSVVPREDWEFVFRISRRHRVEHVPVPTVRYLVNPSSYYANWEEDHGARFFDE